MLPGLRHKLWGIGGCETRWQHFIWGNHCCFSIHTLTSFPKRIEEHTCLLRSAPCRQANAVGPLNRGSEWVRAPRPTAHTNLVTGNEVVVTHFLHSLLLFDHFLCWEVMSALAALYVLVGRHSLPMYYHHQYNQTIGSRHLRPSPYALKVSQAWSISGSSPESDYTPREQAF